MPTQALPPRQPIDLAEREEAVNDFQDATESVLGVAANVFFDRPGFVASNDDVDPLSSAVRAVTRYNCRRWANADKSGFSTRVNNYNAGVCGPYLESIDEFPDGGEIGPEFLGGQCVGVNYLVTLRTEVYPFQDCSTFGPSVSVLGFPGPIRGLVTRTENPSGELCTPNGNAVYLRYGSNPIQETIVAGAGYGATAEILSIAREDGLPDSCGNPDATYQPPAKVTPDTPIPPSITVNLPGIGPTTVEITFGDEGDPTIILPDIGVDFGIEIGGGDGDGDGGGGGGDGVPPGYQGEPSDPIDVAPGDAADETADRNLVGVLVQVIETPPRANQLFNPTEVYTKGSYFVYFGGDGGLSLNPEGAITRQDQFFYAPEGCNRFRVVPNSGFTLRVTPFYQEAE